MERRTRAFLHLLIDAMHSTQSSDVQYLIQRIAPVVLREHDRAQALRKTL